MEALKSSPQQTARLAAQVWECSDNDARRSGLDLAETVMSLGAFSFPVEQLEHSRVGKVVQVGLTFWRRIE